ncbi:hypothetical protein KAR91_16885 [Candidatus Pacearchaeota archaeon]|nr:hypothetical protein [Candidatus Pacearchaeota archaeon]
MLKFDIVGLKVSITETNDEGEGRADIIIHKDGPLTKYKITRMEHEKLGKKDDSDFRDSTIVTQVRGLEFGQDLKELVNLHFGKEINGGKEIKL